MAACALMSITLRQHHHINVEHLSFLLWVSYASAISAHPVTYSIKLCAQRCAVTAGILHVDVGAAHIPAGCIYLNCADTVQAVASPFLASTQ